MEDYHVTDHKFPDVDLLHGAEFATHDGDLLVEGSVGESNELVVFHPIVPALDENQKTEGEQDGHSLGPASAPVLNHAGDQTKNRQSSHTLEDAIVESLFDRINQRRVLRFRLQVFTETDKKLADERFPDGKVRLI